MQRNSWNVINDCLSPGWIGDSIIVRFDHNKDNISKYYVWEENIFEIIRIYHQMQNRLSELLWDLEVGFGSPIFIWSSFVDSIKIRILNIWNNVSECSIPTWNKWKIFWYIWAHSVVPFIPGSNMENYAKNDFIRAFEKTIWVDWRYDPIWYLEAFIDVCSKPLTLSTRNIYFNIDNSGLAYIARAKLNLAKRVYSICEFDLSSQTWLISAVNTLIASYLNSIVDWLNAVVSEEIWLEISHEVWGFNMKILYNDSDTGFVITDVWGNIPNFVAANKNNPIFGN